MPFCVLLVPNAFPIPDSPTQSPIATQSPTNDDFLNPDSSKESPSLVVIVGVVVGGVAVLLLIGISIGLFFLCYYYPNRYVTVGVLESFNLGHP